MKFAQFTLLLAALLLIGQPLMAQIGTPGAPNQSLVLQVENNTNDPFGSKLFKIEGAAGTWTHVLMTCFLPRGDEDLQRFPWMELIETDLSGDPNHYLTDQAKLIVDQTFLYDLINRAGSVAGEEQLVGDVWQNLPGPNAGPSSFYWEARPLNWQGNSQSDDVRSSWSQRREYENVAGLAGNAFSMNKCAIWAMRKQAGSEALGNAAWEDEAKNWILEGRLHIAFQAVSLVDQESFLSPTNPDGTVAGLEDLPEPPKVQISPKVVVQLVKGGLGLTYDPNLPAYAGQIFEARQDDVLTVPMKGIVLPLKMTIKAGNRTFALNGRLASRLGHATFDLPAIITAGQTIECLDIANAFYGPLPISSALPVVTVMAPVAVVAGP